MYQEKGTLLLKEKVLSVTVGKNELMPLELGMGRGERGGGSSVRQAMFLSLMAIVNVSTCQNVNTRPAVGKR